MTWIEVTEVKHHWSAFVLRMMKLRFSYEEGLE
jgi:hypothetical protein